MDRAERGRHRPAGGQVQCHENGERQARDGVPTDEIDAVDRGIPAGIERHQPVDRREGGRQAVEDETGGRDHLHPSRQGGITRRVLPGGQPLQHPGEPAPDREVEGRPGDEERGVEVHRLVTQEGVRLDLVRARPPVQLGQTEQERHEEQGDEGQRSGRGLEHTPDHQPPAAARQVVQHGDGGTAEGDREPVEKGDEVRAEELPPVEALR